MWTVQLQPRSGSSTLFLVRSGSRKIRQSHVLTRVIQRTNYFSVIFSDHLYLLVPLDFWDELEPQEALKAGNLLERTPFIMIVQALLSDGQVCLKMSSSQPFM